MLRIVDAILEGGLSKLKFEGRRVGGILVVRSSLFEPRHGPIRTMEDVLHTEASGGVDMEQVRIIEGSSRGS